jgi:hypothetical protein
MRFQSFQGTEKGPKARLYVSPGRQPWETGTNTMQKPQRGGPKSGDTQSNQDELRNSCERLGIEEDE